mmetsp:Transcript_31676/g.51233  ORF Transcript_31676/g.51233 Transcript_31676/m.51233 type:complete len:634 (-) Transcript_31676:221-2122(-)
MKYAVNNDMGDHRDKKWENRGNKEEEEEEENLTAVYDIGLGENSRSCQSWAGSRWVTIPMGLYVELAAGSAYAFGVYSSQLKHSLGINQTQLNTISSVGNIGGYFAVPAGICFDYYGPKITAFIGGCIVVFGYIMAFLGASGTTNLVSEHSHSSISVIAVAFFIAWHGGSWLDAASVSVNIVNFPHERGVVLGILKSFFGLSGSIFAQVYLSFYVSGDAKKTNGLGATLVSIFGVANCAGRICAGSLSDRFKAVISRPMFYAAALLTFTMGSIAFSFAPENGSSSCPVKSSNGGDDGVPILLFFAITCGSLVAIGTSFLNLIPQNRRTPISKPQRKFIKGGYLLVGLLCVSLAVAGAIQNSWQAKATLQNHRLESASFVGISGLFIVALMTMSLAHFSADSGDDSDQRSSAYEQAALGGHDDMKGTDDLIGDDVYESSRAEDTTGGGGNNDDYEYSGSARRHSGGGGGGVVVVSVREAGFCEAIQTADFYLLFTAQFCGTGAGLMTLNNLGQIATALGSSISIYFGCVLCGFAYGAFWCLNPCLVMEMYGSKSFGSLYSVMNVAPAIGSTVFSVGLASYVYGYHEEEGENCCLGQACYQTTFLVSASMTGVVGIACACAVAYRHRRFYSISPE